MQHILASLKDDGKAAVVVPAGFLTATKRSSKIAFTIRKEIIDNNWLRGVISMPSNIFATTGTSVAIIFLDKSRKSSDQIFLMNATKVGTKVSLEDGQRTILSREEQELIINTFKSKEEKEEFSIAVEKEEIQKKNYSFFAGNYFDTKIEIIELSNDEFYKDIQEISNELQILFEKNEQLSKAILEGMKGLNYE